MRDVFGVVAASLERGAPCALATLVETRSSSPAPLGTSVAVDASGSVAGNIGAGCYEGEIVEAAMQTLVDGELRLVAINLESTDDITGSTGCGGELRIVVWRPDKDFEATALGISLGSADVVLQIPGGYSIDIPAKRRLVLIGATTLAQEIAHMAHALDYFVTVVDPRPTFATAERIPDADQLILEWPDTYLSSVLTNETPVVVLSHDPKFDLPALRCALASQAPYIGLLGSRRSQAARRDSLRDAGISEAQLARIHGPAGMDFGGISAGETALSILAQVVAVRNGRVGAPLDAIGGSIHERSRTTA